MKLYYLIPFETDEAKRNCPGFQPKYLDLIRGHNAQGTISKITRKIGAVTVECKQPYYLIELEAKATDEMKELEHNADVIKIDADITQAKFAAQNIDISGYSDLLGQEQKERLIMQWLTDEDKPISGVAAHGI